MAKGGKSELAAKEPSEADRPQPAQDQPEAAMGSELVYMRASSFSGPLPHPEAIEAYERTLPGAADRIFSMAEQQASHRQSLEKQVVRGDLRRELQGQWMAFSLFLVTLAGGFYLLSIDKDVTGIAAVITALAGPLALFVFKERAGRKEFQQKSLGDGENDEDPSQKKLDTKQDPA